MPIFFWLIGAISYVSLPILYGQGPLAFIMAGVLSVGIITPLRPTTLATQLFKLYLWAFSLFGVGLLGIKLCDWSLLIGLFVLIAARRYLLITRQMLWLLPFLLFIGLQSLWLALDNAPYVGSSIWELGRYLLAALTMVFFYQLRLKRLHIVGWLDSLIVLVGLQAVCMAIGEHTVGLIGEHRWGALSVLMFADPHESRISAFFSDPNKMMCFFLLTLLLRIWLTYRPGQPLSWARQNWLYLGGALLSTARTAIIAVILLLVFFVYFQGFFYRLPLLGTTGLLIIFLIGGTLIWRYNEQVIGGLNQFFTNFLETFGRSRTAAIDGSINTDNRVMVWHAAQTFIQQNLLWGNGLLSEQNLLPIPTHNTVIQLLLDTGLLGTTTYLVGVIVPLFRQMRWWLLVPLMVVPMMFLDLGNFQLIFALLGLLLQPQTQGEANRDENSRFNQELRPGLYGRN